MRHAKSILALATVAVLLLSPGGGVVAAEPSGARKPNVIVVITDDQGYGDFSCLGNPILKTPHLDRLHDQSVRFTDFHVAPMCTPTRGQLLSGRDCLANGAMNVSSGRALLRRELPTLANAMADAGYRCGHFGKWHLGDNYPYRPQDRGFHEAVHYLSSHIGSAPDFWNNDYFDDTYHHNGRREKFQGYTTDVFFNEAIEWMGRRAAEDKPFFCYLATAAAHGPLFVPEADRRKYEGIEFPGVGPTRQGPVARFFGMIANIDDNMGRLEEFLRTSKLRDNTIVVFLTDNGGTVGVPVHNAGMRGRKIDLYEGGHRVPCFVRWPGGGLRPPGDVAELAEVQDLFPTLVELCGASLPKGAELDGISLAPLLRGEVEHLPDRTLVVQFSRMNQPVPRRGDACVLWRRWRLVGDKELYDLVTDFPQKNNVIDEHADVAAKMREEYEKWWGRVSPRVNEFSALTLGADAENPAMLSPCEWQDSFFDQGHQVRMGARRNGAWNVVVDRPGRYEFELRRWPREADAALDAGLPAAKHADGTFPAGVALPIAKARLSIAGFDESRATPAGDKSVTFTAELPAGRTRLKTWFMDAAGEEICGAYYVYVKRL
ncbi:MAG: arylsulfatase [Pirellulales bacterium]|nr:arylsulfatase [Pirellulales bacterium]